ncbi:MAG: DeoR family transcriptional regulator [Chloroflexi bacterium]|nr:DeoR family transcriptional regulator [Chloroflexota bacterium]
MKNISPRQKEILKLVQEKKDLSIEELRKTIGISQATAYREIQELSQMGLVAKVPGGISKIEATSDRCVQCRGETNARTTFIIEQKDGKKLSACCSHCGMMALANNSNINTAMTIDFVYGKMLNVSQAWYVVNSVVTLCCSPSILSFSNREDATRFTQGFGGEVMDFPNAQKSLNKMMTLIQI